MSRLIGLLTRFAFREMKVVLRRSATLYILVLVLALMHFGAEPSRAAEKPVVYFGINLRYSPRTMYRLYQPLVDYLTANTPYRFELKITRDYWTALRDLQERKTLIAWLGDGAFVDAILMDVAVPIVKPLNEEGQPLYRSMIVVPGASPIRSVRELKGKSFVFGSYHSISGNLVPRYLLQQAGVDYGELRSVTALPNHDAVIKAILKGQYDAGAVKDQFAARYRPYGLRVLAYSDPYPSVPFMIRRDAPKALRESVLRALLRLDPRLPAHRRILSQWDDEFRYGFAAASARDYHAVIGMFRNIPFGCGAGCH